MSYRLIWFQHFHKAAGTSIVKMADLNGEFFYPTHRNGNPHFSNGKKIDLWKFSDSDLTEFIDQCQFSGVTFVSNEWGGTNFKLLALDPRVILITCIRNPFKRFISNYFYSYLNGYSDRNTPLSYVDSGACYTMFNYYCRILSKHEDNPEPVSENHFKLAKEALGCFDHITVLEDDFNFSSVRQFLNWKLPSSSTHYKSSSLIFRPIVGSLRKGRFDLIWRRVKSKKRKISGDFEYKFNEANIFDNALYEGVRKEFNEKPLS